MPRNHFFILVLKQARLRIKIEMRLHIAPAGLTCLLPRTVVFHEANNLIRQSNDIALLGHRRVPLYWECFCNSFGSKCDDRQSLGLSLANHRWQAFGVAIPRSNAWSHEYASPLHPLPNIYIRLVTQKDRVATARCSFAFQHFAQRTVTHDHEPSSWDRFLHSRHGMNEMNTTLLPHEPANKENCFVVAMLFLFVTVMELDPNTMNP
ncbi:MAG TPA: hypothetical protein VKH40_03520 [Alloacidobacterium sp.]|nr:hypothetical protein [Alloacidobacterium sp.]